MKKTILKIVSIVAAFFLGVVFMSYYQAAGNRDLTDAMADATLPLVYVEQDGRLLNCMRGYTQEMEGSYMRDSVLPIPEERNIRLRIECPDAEVERILFEVRSLDTTRLIEDTEVDDYTREDELILANFQLKDLLEEGEEYLLVIRLELEQEQEAFYYTRLLNDSETYVEECLEFVNQIHTAIFEKESAVSIAQYLEPDGSADNDTLAYVNIHSRYRQLVWGDMDVQICSLVDLYITELESSIAAVRLEYEVEHKNKEEKTERYQVQESYRVRYTKQRMYLLDYERTMERIFEPEANAFSDNAIQLGILNGEVEYKKNAAENIVGFVQNGELWSYDVAQNKLSHVFGFREGGDLRCSDEDHEIKILDIGESGSMHFLVYGYMSRGWHEGKTGVAVYTYDALTHSVEERIFIESKKPFQIVEADLGELGYVNIQEILYLHYQENIYRIDLNTREYQEVVSQIADENCMISQDGRLAAWPVGNSLHEAETIRILNLETGYIRDVQAKEGFCLQALGFMGTDLIYGEARKEDVQRDITGRYIFPMGYLVIQNEQGEVIREFPYEEQGKYVLSLEIEDNRILLDCAEKNEDGSYVKAAPEPITNKMAEKTEKISLETRNSAVKKREYCFALADGLADSQMKVLTPRQVLFEGSRNWKPEETQLDEFYYAYAFDGTLIGAYKAVNEAVEEAYERMGVVVDSSQNYIWQRGGRKTRTEIRGFENPQEKPGETGMQAALEILLGQQKNYTDAAGYLAEGYTPYEILRENVNGRVLDLSGCSVGMVLYYVSQGYPVLALESDTQAELITGYDPQNIILTDPLTGEAYRKGMNDSTQMFEELGNLFVVCLTEQEK